MFVHFLSALHRVAGIEEPNLRFWMGDGVPRRFDQNLQRSDVAPHLMLLPWQPARVSRRMRPPGG
jgi:hypothetical protein